MSDYSKEYEPIDNIQCSLGAIEGELDNIRNSINLLIEQYQNRKEQMNKDAVSREAVLDYIRDNYRRWFINDDAFMQCVNGIKDIVPVIPEQRTGKWIYKEDTLEYECSECSRVVSTHRFENPYIRYPYCHCGAKMEMEGESE